MMFQCKTQIISNKQKAKTSQKETSLNIRWHDPNGMVTKLLYMSDACRCLGELLIRRESDGGLKAVRGDAFRI